MEMEEDQRLIIDYNGISLPMIETIVG